MSNKLDEVLKKSKAFYEEEKKKFLDALGSFIELNLNSISVDVCYKFIIAYRLRGADERQRNLYGYDFFIGKNSYQNTKDYFLDEVRITLSMNTISKILESEYNANITSAGDDLCREIMIPFVW